MLDYREHGQGTMDEHKGKDFKRELEERERIAIRSVLPIYKSWINYIGIFAKQ